jgi:hypothetical protein
MGAGVCYGLKDLLKQAARDERVEDNHSREQAPVNESSEVMAMMSGIAL